MTKEKTDQFIRCVKECWWRIGVLLLMILGFALLVIHGWPKGDWSFGWGALGAIFTLITGGIAAKIALHQKEYFSRRQKNESLVLETEFRGTYRETHKLILEICMIVEEICKIGSANQGRESSSYIVEKRCRLLAKLYNRVQFPYFKFTSYAIGTLSCDDLQKIKEFNKLVEFLNQGGARIFIKSNDDIFNFLSGLELFLTEVEEVRLDSTCSLLQGSLNRLSITKHILKQLKG